MSPTSRSPSPTPSSGPLPIRRLQDSLINRIAAGEIIHRPSSALKELLENSLDADATSIRVTVKDGGMKLLQIQDNGCGIRKSDLPILAERFTTSKLSTFSDLSRLTTYGFRGEALASISHVARLTVVTKTKPESCAWKACYTDGTLTPAKPGTSPDPKPCAGNDGTTITIEDLFYNTPTRLAALRGTAEEYARILDVLTRYAVHNPNVAFVCKKVGSSTPDLSTPSASTTSQAIRLLYGQAIARELLTTTLSSSTSSTSPPSASRSPSPSSDPEPDSDSWSAEAHFTSSNYNAKKTVFLLFINHRLVDSPRLKRALEGAYTGILPKGAAPFIYLSLQVDPRGVDVNVHPTKRAVHFLAEDDVAERVSAAIAAALAGGSRSRVFEYQTLLTGGVAAPGDEDGRGKKRKGKGKQKEVDVEDEDQGDGEDENEDADEPPPTSTAPRKTASQHKVRTSLQDRTLDSMIPVASPSQAAGSNAPRETPESSCILTSVRNLRQTALKAKHMHLSEILEKHIFVGIVDLTRGLSLLQHATKLYLVNHGALAEELFYQLGLRQFGDFRRLKLAPPPSLRALVTLAVDAEEGTQHSKMSKAEITDCIVETLLARRDMLAEYFSLGITADGLVETLPLLLRDYIPSLDKLPTFLMRLGPQVDWTSETECFDTFLRELAYFYVPGPPSLEGEEAQEKAERWQIQHVLFSAMRRYLAAPRTLLERDVVQVASLPDLYRVFERC